MRCRWIVRAGVLPGQPDPDLTRSFVITAGEWADDTSRDRVWLERQGAATVYALSLQDPSRVNWVAMEFVWA